MVNNGLKGSYGRFNDFIESNVARYLDEIKSKEPLSREEEIELSKKIRLGDKDALDKLVTSNLKFVITIAKNYKGRGLSIGDLINEGNFGLIKAAKRYDETMGNKFISYAVWWIRQSMLEALRGYSHPIRIPGNIDSDIIRLNRRRERLVMIYQREPTYQEMLQEGDLNIDRLEDIKKSNHPLKLDDRLGEGDDALITIIEDKQTTRPDSILMQESKKEEIREILKTLNKRECNVIKLYFGIDCNALSLEDIGVKYKLTRERVRQIKQKALRRLRHRSRSRELVDY